MRRWLILAPFFLGAWSLLAQQETIPPPSGFTAASAPVELDWERQFRQIPSADNIRDDVKLLSARPHHVGSPYDKQNADWLVDRFTQWGWDTHVETFQVLFPTPKERVLELVAPTRFAARLQEPPVPGDPTSNQQAEQLPSYNAYSIDGDVTAPLVYVNYGVPQDYEELARLGISVKGAIVIARYGGSWRGIKPKVAAEHGAVGCLIYSDPREDGFAEGDVFPKGAWRPPDGVQRGSVMDMPLYPGDPLTPGVGATSTAKRLDRKDVKTLTTIPVLPISYADAQPLLSAIDGAVAPPNWRGSLGITYHIGPGPAKVHLKVKFNWDMKPIRDVIARIPGSDSPDEWVIRGNHYDAWVNGAQDPDSGMSAELEEARALGELVKIGWKPKRTIIYCAWDAEEPGLLGSTEWVEEHADELRQHAVAYINSDSNSRGYISLSGSHSLETFINEVAHSVPDPEKGVPVWRREQLHLIAQTSAPEDLERLRGKSTWPIDALGSGSDYTAFLDFAGVPSLNIAFGGESGGGIYHSIYDDFYWYSHFDDPSFGYSRALAQTAGVSVMRLAGADLLPFNFLDLSATIRRYISEIEKLAGNQTKSIVEKNRQLAEGVFTATADPTLLSVPPAIEPEPPTLNFTIMETALGSLDKSAQHYKRASEDALKTEGPERERTLAKVNTELLQAERALTDHNGLPGRSWYKHQLYAPGFYTGYAVKTIPAVREAIELKQWTLAQHSIESISSILDAEASVIERAATDLEVPSQSR